MYQLRKQGRRYKCYYCNRRYCTKSFCYIPVHEQLLVMPLRDRSLNHIKFSSDQLIGQPRTVIVSLHIGQMFQSSTSNLALTMSY